LLLQGLLTLELDLLLRKLVLLRLKLLLDLVQLLLQVPFFLLEFGAQSFQQLILLLQRLLCRLLKVFKGSDLAVLSVQLLSQCFVLIHNLPTLSIEVLQLLVHLRLVGQAHGVERLLGLSQVLVESFELLVFKGKFALVLVNLLTEFFLEHLDLVLEHFDIILVVGGLVAHLLLVFGDHLREATRCAVFLLIKALLKPLLL